MQFSPWGALKRLVLPLALVVPLGAGGCGGSTGTVTGKVTCGGVPVRGGNVTFVGANGHSALAPIQQDGSYTAEKVPVGPVKIAVETSSLAKQAALPRNAPPPGQAQGGRKGADPEELARRYVPIAAHYEDPETSGLTYTVKAGKQQHDIPLAAEGAPAGGQGPGAPRGSLGGPR